MTSKVSSSYKCCPGTTSRMITIPFAGDRNVILRFLRADFVLDLGDLFFGQSIDEQLVARHLVLAEVLHLIVLRFEVRLPRDRVGLR